MKADIQQVIVIPGPDHEKCVKRAQLLIKQIAIKKMNQSEYPKIGA